MKSGTDSYHGTTRARCQQSSWGRASRDEEGRCATMKAAFGIPRGFVSLVIVLAGSEDMVAVVPS